MRRPTNAPLVEGQLWLSRPPYMLVALIKSVRGSGSVPLVEYELFDDDGSLLLGPVSEPLDSTWWRSFQPLVRNQG